MNKERKPNGYWSKMTNEKLVRYIEENHKGETVNQMERGKDGQAYDVARERGLIDSLVEKRVLVREKRDFWSKMSDEELVRYIEENHKGKYLTQIQHSKDGQAYDVARERGLIDSLVDEGILIRGKKVDGYWSKMSDEELVRYIEENHKGESIKQLQKGKGSVVYLFALRRGLIEGLVKNKVLLREYRCGFWSKMSDEELVRYIEENHKGKTISQFQKGADKSAYKILRERGLIDSLVDEGILIRERESTRTKQQGESLLEEWVNGR